MKVNKFYIAISKVSPILISIISLAVAIASWSEARKANELNAERVKVVVQPNIDSGSSVGPATCMGDVVSIPLTWRFFIFNNSAQPVTIESAEYVGYSNNGMVNLLPELGSSSEKKFPLTIAARASATFLTTVPINAPRAYGTWYRTSGLCNNYALDAQKIASRAGFTNTGGTSSHPSFAGVAASFKTSDRNVIESQANWDDPIVSSGPNFKLPAQADQ